MPYVFRRAPPYSRERSPCTTRTHNYIVFMRRTVSSTRCIALPRCAADSIGGRDRDTRVLSEPILETATPVCQIPIDGSFVSFHSRLIYRLALSHLTRSPVRSPSHLHAPSGSLRSMLNDSIEISKFPGKTDRSERERALSGSRPAPSPRSGKVCWRRGTGERPREQEEARASGIECTSRVAETIQGGRGGRHGRPAGCSSVS